jgi:hypothetical protein
MSFHFGCWLRGTKVRRSGRRPGSTGTAVPRKDEGRRCGLNSMEWDQDQVNGLAESLLDPAASG